MQQKIKEIEKKIRDFLAKLKVEAEVEGKSDGEEVWVDIEADEPALLIGKGGQTLHQLQHVVRLFINQGSDDFTYLTIDVNKYKTKQKEEVQEEALETIEKVKKQGQPQMLRPMSSYKRKIVHLVVKKEEGLESESVGEEPSRRVMIKVEEE